MHIQALRRLRRADETLRTHVGQPASLATGNPVATRLEVLGRGVLCDRTSEEVAIAFAQGLSEIVEAQVEQFPETIFWDMDFLAASLLRTPGGAAGIEALAREIVLLQKQYGRNSVICFRYVHDFSYGFDWAKWVASAPEARAHIGPFDPEFIHYLRRRGEELVTLIAEDDKKYPKLPDGRPRNPFGFSREPDDERRLTLELASQGLIPVSTWRVDARPRWDRPYAEIREALAREIGLKTRT